MTPLIVMETEIRADGVHYAVIHNGRYVWSKFVPFGKRREFRACGPAFVEAAREQERHAEQVADVQLCNLPPIKGAP